MDAGAESATTSKGHVIAAVGVVDTRLGAKLILHETVGPEVLWTLVHIGVVEHPPVVDEDGRASGDAVTTVLYKVNKCISQTSDKAYNFFLDGSMGNGKRGNRTPAVTLLDDCLDIREVVEIIWAGSMIASDNRVDFSLQALLY